MIDTDVVNPIKTDNPDFDVFFNTDKTLHEMLENPGAYEIGVVLKYVFEKRKEKQITATDRSNQTHLVKLLQLAFSKDIMSYREADAIAIWLDELVNNQTEKQESHNADRWISVKDRLPTEKDGEIFSTNIGDVGKPELWRYVKILAVFPPTEYEPAYVAETKFKVVKL